MHEVKYVCVVVDGMLRWRCVCWDFPHFGHVRACERVCELCCRVVVGK